MITNISVTLSVNFTAKVFSGSADLTVQKILPDVNEVVGSYSPNK